MKSEDRGDDFVVEDLCEAAIDERAGTGMRRPGEVFGVPLSQDRSKLRVLVFIPFYLPFVKGGGPTISVSNMVAALSESHEFLIVTGDRDLGDDNPAESLTREEWVRCGNALVLRLPSSKLGLRRVIQIIREVGPDAVYVNSVFSFRYSVLPALAMRFLGDRPPQLIIAPRGELYPGALAIKRVRKSSYLQLARLLGVYRRVRWHATSSAELGQIIQHFGGGTEIVEAPNLGTPPPAAVALSPEKLAGSLRLVFLSRITEKKGLFEAVSCLQYVSGSVHFDICGPVESEAYWRRCREVMSALPPSVTVRYLGTVPHAQVPERLLAAHVFILPTKGENYGHVIAEALSLGRPVITSRDTPWVELIGRGAGLESGDSPREYAACVQEFIDMDGEEFQKRQMAAWQYAITQVAGRERATLYHQLLGRRTE